MRGQITMSVVRDGQLEFIPDMEFPQKVSYHILVLGLLIEFFLDLPVVAMEGPQRIICTLS